MTVVGADLIRSDAYATAAIAMGDSARAWLESRAGYEAFAVAADGSGWWTSGYPGRRQRSGDLTVCAVSESASPSGKLNANVGRR